MKLILLSLAIAGQLFAQSAGGTKITDDQVVNPPVATVTVRLLIPSTLGLPASTIYAVLGAGLRLNTTASPPRLELDIPPPVVVVVGNREVVLSPVTGTDPGVFQLPPEISGPATIWRNGLGVTAGVDYTRTGQVVRFDTTRHQILATDIVKAIY